MERIFCTTTMTSADARLAAEVWVYEEAARIPEAVGVVLAGSTRGRDPEAPHPAGSDVDLFIYVDARVPSDIVEPRGRFAPRKLAFRGVVLEPSFHDAQCLADPEAVLGDMHLAPLFTRADILFDPQGRLKTLAAAVTPEVLRRCHARRRLAQALAWALPTDPYAAVPHGPGLGAACWRHVAHAFCVMRCACATLVAGLRRPTTRRSFVVARELLRAAEREDLADALLRLLGSLTLSPTEVEGLAEEAERTYDRAVELRRTPVALDWNVSREARDLERAAVRELILAGHHREALFQLLLVRTVVQGIIENDGDEKTRLASRRGYRRLLAALGIEGDDSLRARGQELRAFLPALREGCEALLARAPGLRD